MNPNLPNARLSDSQRRIAAQTAIGSRIEKIAFGSKLRHGNMPHHQSRNRRSELTGQLTQSDISKISQEQQIRLIDNQNAIELMPEIEWASRVLCSSILSPKDMTKRELNYSIGMEWIPPDIRAHIADKIKEDMEKLYDYSDSMYAIIKDALFTKGSHPRIVLPEAVVDRIINNGQVLTFESLSSNLYNPGSSTLKSAGWFGPRWGSDRVALTVESFAKALNEREAFSSTEAIEFKDEGGAIVSIPELSITDNIEALKLPSYMDAIMSQRRDAAQKLPTADFGDMFGEIVETNENNKLSPTTNKTQLSHDEFKQVVYKSAPTNIVTHMRIPGTNTVTRRSVGRPLVKSPSPESMITVHFPGEPSRHLGYLYLTDETGHGITLTGADQVLARASAMMNSANSTNSVGKDGMGSMILSKAARNLSGGKDVTTIKEINKVVERIIEENVVGRMMNGAYPGGAEIGDATDLFELMTARVFCSLRTRIIFIPAEYVTYFAFDYHPNGMGRSLLDSNKMLIAMRAGILLTRMTGEMRNSIPLTEVTMKIDDDDVDFEKTAEDTLHILSQTRQPQYPLSTLAVNDIMDWIHRAGFVLKFAEHPNIPDTGFEFNKINHENRLPDQAFYDSLGKQLYMGFGIPPELMDTTYDPEFATAIANRNIIFTQTVMEAQKKLSGLITDDVQRLSRSDGNIVQEIAEMIKEKWGSIASSIPDEEKEIFNDNPKAYAMDLVRRCIESIEVSLPSPDATTIDGQMEQYRKYKEFITEAADAYLGQGAIPESMAPELAAKAEGIKQAWIAAMLRSYMAEQSMLPELQSIASTTEDGEPAYDLFKLTADLARGIGVNAIGLARALAPADQAVGKDAKAIGMGGDAPGGMGGGMSSPMGSPDTPVADGPEGFAGFDLSPPDLSNPTEAPVMGDPAVDDTVTGTPVPPNS